MSIESTLPGALTKILEALASTLFSYSSCSPSAMFMALCATSKENRSIPYLSQTTACYFLAAHCFVFASFNQDRVAIVMTHTITWIRSVMLVLQKPNTCYNSEQQHTSAGAHASTSKYFKCGLCLNKMVFLLCYDQVKSFIHRCYNEVMETHSVFLPWTLSFSWFLATEAPETIVSSLLVQHLVFFPRLS